MDGAPLPSSDVDPTARLIAEATRRGLRIAVAESLTGGLLTAELVRIPGASLTLAGGVVAYDTSLKHALLGVDAALLERVGAVDAEVARQMATGVCETLRVGGRAADLGIATTGVAGPDSQDGKPPGTVFVATSLYGMAHAIELRLSGDRGAIRGRAVEAAIEAALARLEGADGPAE